ncbi:hypothetical protein ACA910_004081 [Epithemia clementina (nom. ined.)]
MFSSRPVLPGEQPSSSFSRHQPLSLKRSYSRKNNCDHHSRSLGCHCHGCKSLSRYYHPGRQKQRFASTFSSSSSSSWRFPPLAGAPPSENEVAQYGLPLLRQAAKFAAQDPRRIFLYERPPVPQNDSSISKGDGGSASITYHQTVQRALAISEYLQQQQNIRSRNNNNKQTFVAQLMVPGWEYVASLWGCWHAGHGCVPLTLSHKLPDLEHILSDTQPEFILLGGDCRYNYSLDHSAAPTTLPPGNADLLEQAAQNVGLVNRIVHLRDVFHDSRGKILDGLSSLKEGEKTGAQAFQRSDRHNISLDAPALVLYTSGTTGRPKGVVSSHRNVYHQVTDLVSAWEWQPNDVALHVLPLHHVHGVINILCCTAFVGAQVRFRSFDAIDIWNEWASTTTFITGPRGSSATTMKVDKDENTNAATTSPTPPKYSSPPRQTVLMAVPTIYVKLLQAAEQQQVPPETVQKAVDQTLSRMRLMVSGSAALPVSVFEHWKHLTGHALLERYGMTEFAMALSNPYQANIPKHAGHVGKPLPSVQVKIVDEQTKQVIVRGDNYTGTQLLFMESKGPPETTRTTTATSGAGVLLVKGPTVFQEYLNRPEATNAAFADDEGYFDTGDIALYNAQLDSYRILGRASVDILKVGGHKLSALDIERVLLEHDDISEVAVVGVPHDVWGQQVGVVLCSSSQALSSDKLTLRRLQQWCQDKLESHAIPRLLLMVDEIPKNAMGKVNKKYLANLFVSSL